MSKDNSTAWMFVPIGYIVDLVLVNNPCILGGDLIFCIDKERYRVSKKS